MKEEKKAIRRQIEEWTKQIKEERKAREEEQRERKEKQEIKILDKKVAELEMDKEKRGEEERKNNIVIRRVDQRTERLELEVSGYIKENTNTIVKMKKASKIKINEDKNIIIAEMESWA